MKWLEFDYLQGNSWKIEDIKYCYKFYQKKEKTKKISQKAFASILANFGYANLNAKEINQQINTMFPENKEKHGYS